MSSNIVGGILCGGLGKRLKPITDSIPKSLIEIKDNYCILDRQLFQMKFSGIEQVYLLSGYLHEKIEERYGKSWNGLRIEHIVEDRPRGTLYAINSLLKASNSDARIVMNGDIVTDLNLKQMINQWTRNQVSIAVTKLVSPYGIVELSNDKIIGFKEKPVLPYYINGGIYLIDSSLKENFLSHEKGNVEKLVFPSLAKMGMLSYYMEEDTFWQSIDSQKDIEVVRNEFVNRIDKPWGYEKTIVVTEKYMTTQLYIMKDFSIPKHYHRHKDMTLHVFFGEGYVYFDDERVQINKGDVIHVPPMKKHEIVSKEALAILSYSTPESDDYVSSIE